LHVDDVKSVCLGIPDQLMIVGNSRGQYSDQFEVRWTVRSASQLIETLLRLKSVGYACLTIGIKGNDATP